MEDINELIEQLDDIRNKLVYGDFEIDYRDIGLIESAITDIDNALDIMRRATGW